MSIIKIFHWVLRIAIFLLVLILVINNMQTVEFNIYGIYYLKLPLIVLTLIFLFIGLVTGILISGFKGLKLKAKISQLETDLHDIQKNVK